MKHVSITYSDWLRKWQVMIDGQQDRRVAFSGELSECQSKAKRLARELDQPLFQFEKNGWKNKQIKI